MFSAKKQSEPKSKVTKHFYLNTKDFLEKEVEKNKCFICSLNCCIYISPPCNR